MEEAIFKRAFKKMLEQNSNGVAEIDRVIKYAPTLKEKKKAKHDKELMESMKDRPLEIVFLHEMQSVEVARDLISIMSLENFKDLKEK